MNERETEGAVERERWRWSVGDIKKETDGLTRTVGYYIVLAVTMTETLRWSSRDFRQKNTACHHLLNHV